MTIEQRKEHLHRTSVAGNTVAGVAGGAFGAAKLRDLHEEQYRPAHGRLVQHVALKHARAGALLTKKPGFKTALIGSTAGAAAAGARRYSEHQSRVHHRKQSGDTSLLAKSAFGVELAKFDAGHRAADRSLRTRAKQAIDPPPVRRRPVESSALHSMGYQRQTRRMEVSFNGRPDKTYTYRMKPKDAAEFTAADSRGRHYAKQVKGQFRDGRRVTVAGRARLFADPEPVSKSAFGVDLGYGETSTRS